MARIERFEDLDIWKEAVAIGVDIYGLTSQGKLEKDYSSKDQLRRAAISVSNNIAEGFEYNNNKVFMKFLGYAKGSAGELRSNLFVLKEAGMVNTEDHDRLAIKLLEASKNIKGFIKYLNDYESKRSPKNF
ncbi:MAG TPA: four helix bundle protein [Ohtaekwangia sp.]|uniref:four helix bundle protein n=1 Tax=Ohtaekwangia sp. TaxID=2066019 RepID=UPI002F92D4F1